MKLLKKNIEEGKKVYFISDCHFGIPDASSSRKREHLLISLLEEIRKDAVEIYLLGDVFDFWFEYKYVVPKGYVRLFGKLAELSDAGIVVNFFTGNHDMWAFNYFKEELGLRIYRKPVLCDYNGKILYIGHGDGLGPGDYGYKFIKKIFSNKVCQWLFARLHPNFAFSIALFFSKRSRLARGNSDSVFLGEEKERLIQFAKSEYVKNQADYFVFGHRHLPMDLEINDKCRYMNIGDWFYNFSYIEFDGSKMNLKYYSGGNDK